MRALRRPTAAVSDHVDQVVVAVLAGTALPEVRVTGGSWWDAALAGAVAVPLLARRSAPLIVLALVIAVSYAGYARGPDIGGSLQAWIALNVALYSVAAHQPRRGAIAGAAIAGVFVLAFEVARLVEGGRVVDVAGEWLSLGGVWLAGRWVRRRRRRTD